MSKQEELSGKITLIEALQELAYARNIAVLNGQNVNAAQKALEATPQWQALQDAKKAEAEAKEDVRFWDQAARTLTDAAFRETGDKAPAAGASIRFYSVPKYDRTELLTWCQEHRPTYVTLQLDMRRVEKEAEDLIKDGAPIIIEADPRVTIATDLSRYLAPNADDHADEVES